jgi:hypothetical protein
MTAIESIYEIEADLHDLQPYLNSKSPWAAKRARGKYERLVDRFFREHGRVTDPEQRSACLHDDKYFLSLLESTRESYYSDHECSP